MHIVCYAPDRETAEKVKAALVKEFSRRCASISISEYNEVEVEGTYRQTLAEMSCFIKGFLLGRKGV